MSMRFPGQRRPPGQKHVQPHGTLAEVAAIPTLTLVGDRGGRSLRVLDGCAPFGAGCDELVALLADACVPADPLELRGEAEALAAFRATQGRAVRHRLPVAGSGRRAAARRAARRVRGPVTGSSGTAPMVGSVLAVAASAAVMVLGYGGALGIPLPVDGGRATEAGTSPRPARSVPGTGAGGSVIPGPASTAAGGEGGTTVTSAPTPGRRGAGPDADVDSVSGPIAPGRVVAGEPVRTPWSPTPTASGSAGELRSTDDDPRVPGAGGGSGASTRSEVTTGSPRPARSDRSAERRRRSDRSVIGSTEGSMSPNEPAEPLTTSPEQSTDPAVPSTTGAPAGDDAGDEASAGPPPTSPSGSVSPIDAPTFGITVAGRVMVLGQMLPPELRSQCMAWRHRMTGPGGAVTLLAPARDEDTVDTVCDDLLIRTLLNRTRWNRTGS